MAFKLSCLFDLGWRQVVAEVSEDLGEAMTGINCDGLSTRFADREGGNMPAHKKQRTDA